MERNALDFSALFHRMDQLFTGFYPWLAGQYDQATGGFRYAVSSRQSAAFEPDIESTAQALNILERSELLPAILQWMKERMIRFFQAKQDPDSGFFYDRNPKMRNDEVMVARAIGYATGSLRKLSAQPLYPLPVQALSAPEYLASADKYAEWLRSIDLRNSWRGCDRLATSSAYVAQIPAAAREAYIQEALRYFADIQDQATGLWGDGSLYVRISGTFKLYTFYSRFNIPMPNARRIYDSILNCLRQETAKDMCYIRNPINLLSYMKVKIAENELQEIIAITANNMAQLKRPDGGFSREIGNSPVAPNVAQVKAGEFYPDMPEPVCLSRGLYEGDMNAGTQAHLIRLQCHELAGIQAQPLPEARTFYELLGASRQA